MTIEMGTTGLIFNEPLLWERGRTGRQAYSMPDSDVPEAELAADLMGADPEFPDLAEIEVVRHFTRLSQWNFGVDSGMYPLGSCTMKYNPKTNERQAAISNFTGAHPLTPPEHMQGLLKMMHQLENFLTAITGFDAATLQPTAGAHGELCGILIFHAYHQSKGKPRSKIIVADTAHGTNPASAALCGYKPVPVKSHEDGYLDPQTVADVMDEDTAGIMITNPNTIGLFERRISEIARIVHDKGGLVYGDGANLNAIMGYVDVKKAGIDVMHLNLHKTFSTPHGGGGPGSGPVVVRSDLERFLPVPRVVKDGDKFILSEDFPQSIGKMHAFFGNVGVMIRAYSYILSMGAENLKNASRMAVLNGNYVKESLKGIFHLAYDQPCMHECVFSDKNHHDYKVTTLDIVKRLIDYGFHPPTIYFPLVVPGAIMVEPTETETKEDLDRFIEAMKAITKDAESDPRQLYVAPTKTKVSRLDETGAARRPCLAG